MSYDPLAAAQSHQHQHQDSRDYDPYYGHSAPYPTYDSHPTPYKDQGSMTAAEQYDPQSEPYRQEGVLPPGTMADKDIDLFQPPPKSTGDLRIWRQDHHGNLWTKGGRGRYLGRFCCCTIMSIFLVCVSLLLTLAMFLRPPNIEFSGITSANSVVANSTSLDVELGIGIVVDNRNFFTIKMKSISLSVTYPINNTEIGGGHLNNIVFNSNSKTMLSFPFHMVYKQSSDPNGAVLIDMANKCGFIPGATKQQLTVGYSLKLAMQVLSITISPPFSGKTSFDCPFSLSEIGPLIASVPGLGNIMGGGIP